MYIEELSPVDQTLQTNSDSPFRIATNVHTFEFQNGRTTTHVHFREH